MTAIDQSDHTNLVQKFGNDLRDALNKRYGEASMDTLNQAFNACVSLVANGNRCVKLEEVEKLLGLEEGFFITGIEKIAPAITSSEGDQGNQYVYILN